MIEANINGYYPHPGAGWSGSLADYQPYYYDDVADWLHTPIRRSGTDNDGETGTGWSTVGTERHSSTVDDTIEWTGTFCSCAIALSGPCTIAWKIDAGAYTEMVQVVGSPGLRELYATDRDVHTVTIKVVAGTVKINGFVAI